MNDEPTIQMRRISGVDATTVALLEKHFGLSLADGIDLLGSLETIKLTGDAWLFRQNDPGDALYFLVRGRLQAWRNGDEGGPDSAPVLLGEIVPGDSVGEAGVLTGQPRSAGVRAIRDSLLVRLDRALLTQLTQRNPSVIMKLASSVATRMHRNAAPRAAGTRPLRTITLVSLVRSPKVDAFCKALATGLAEEGLTLELRRERLAELGAPVQSLGVEAPIDDRLKHWLHDREFDARFLVYHAEQSCNPWSRFAVRQADLQILIGEAGADPQPQDWESQLIAGAEAGTGARRALVLLQPPAEQGIQGTAAWLDPRRIDFHLHAREDRPQDLKRILRILTGRATGVVMGAGAARGFAHLGVYRAMAEAGVPIEWVGGASIGAVMAGTVANDWEPGLAIAMAHEAFVKGKPFSDYTLPLVSLLSGKRLDRLTRKYLSMNIEDMPIPYFCVSSNLSEGTLNIHERGPLWRAVCASVALPGVLPPGVIDSQLVIDGSVLNSLPVDVMQGKPVGKVIAIDLSARKAHRIDYEKVPSAWELLRARFTPGARKPKVPGLATVMLKAIEIGTIGRVRELGMRADLLLKPPVSKFSMLSVKAFHAVVEAGYLHAREMLPAWVGAERTESSQKEV